MYKGYVLAVACNSLERVGSSGPTPVWLFRRDLCLQTGPTNTAGKISADVALLTVPMEFVWGVLTRAFSSFIHISINTHMAALDIASVIGTWVAAFVAVLALVGIIGPILIWRASRTERHLAIAAIEDDNNTFKSRGIHAGPGIWLLQRIRAPMLDSPLASFEELVSLSLGMVKEPISSTSWIQFGYLLQAYGEKYRTGGRLEIWNRKAYLPVDMVKEEIRPGRGLDFPPDGNLAGTSKDAISQHTTTLMVI